MHGMIGLVMSLHLNINKITYLESIGSTRPMRSDSSHCSNWLEFCALRERELRVLDSELVPAGRGGPVLIVVVLVRIVDSLGGRGRLLVEATRLLQVGLRRLRGSLFARGQRPGLAVGRRELLPDGSIQHALRGGRGALGGRGRGADHGRRRGCGGGGRETVHHGDGGADF